MTIRTCLLAGAVLAAVWFGGAQAQEAAPKSTAISGRVFYDLSDRGDGVEFDLKRLYLTVDQRLGKGLSASLTTDFQYSTRDGATDAFVKKAYLQAKLSEALTVRVGAADTPWISYVDGLYGYRWIDKTLIDRTEYGQSSDWGVHILGAVPGGVITYAVSAIDGGGYRDPSKSNSVDFEGRVGAKLADFQFGVGGYKGKRGEDLPGRPALHTARRVNAALAYAPKALRIGVELFAAENWNNVAKVASDRSRGYSAFGSYAFSRRVSAFSRYDRVEPKRTTAPAREESFFNAGAAYTPVRNVDLAVVYKRKSIETGIAPRRTSDEVGVWGQLRF